MAKVSCKGCGTQFESTNHVKDGSAAAAGAAAGAWIGSGIGIAGGPFGAIAGTIPGALIGGTLAFLGAKTVVQCPNGRCGKVFFV